MQIALSLQARGDDARWKSHNCVMIDSAAWFEFNSGYFSPRKVGTVKIRQNRVFTLGDKWETLLVKDLGRSDSEGAAHPPRLICPNRSLTYRVSL